MPKGFGFMVVMIVMLAIFFAVTAILYRQNLFPAIAGGALFGLIIGLAEMRYRRRH